MEEPVPDVPEHLQIEQLKQENATLKAQLKEKEKTQSLRQRLTQRMLGLIWKTTVGQPLSISIENILTKLKSGVSPSMKEFGETLEGVIIRTTTPSKWRLAFTIFISIMTVFLSGISIFFLYQQNQLVEQQNILVKQQNDFVKVQTQLAEVQTEKAEQQSYLAESARRAALVAELTEIMNKIDEELDEHDKKGQKGKHTLSPRLIGRIIGLSRSLKPYKYLNNEGELTELLSPERGQLLINLVNSDIDTTSLIDIYKKADFSYADLQKVVLRNYYFSKGANTPFLKGADLKRANLQKADLSGVDLRGANLTDANLQRATLSYSNLRGANLTDANLQKSVLDNANFQETQLREANFQRATLSSSNLRGANLIGANFQETDLQEANLQDIEQYFYEDERRRADFMHHLDYLDYAETGSDIKHPEPIDFTGAYLNLADFTGADLMYACFQDAHLTRVNFQDADLGSAYFQGANLMYARFHGASLSDANLEATYFFSVDLRYSVNLSNAYLLNLKVSSPLWFSDLQRLSEPPIGLEELMKKYELDIRKTYKDCKYCAEYYKIIEK